jgi:gliding motility-associated-like protein
MQPSVNTNINQHFINVIVKNSPMAIGSFTIDGVNYGSSFQPHPASPDYAYARIGVSRGTHNLYCDTPFNAIAYGFGNAESYGYSAGTNLRDLYQFVSIKNLYGTVSFPAGCKSSPLQFSMTFPYQPLSITWKFNGLFNDTTLFNPVYDSTWVVNGKTIYRYKLDRSYQVDKTGTYPIMLVANNPSADGCSGIQEIEYDLQIFDPPQASFQTVFSGCIADSARFTDLSGAGNLRPVIQRSWSFGDGSASAVTNPVIKYATGGTYKVALRVITDIGCISETAESPIEVSNTPMALFEPSGPFCEEGKIQFNDSSKGFGTGLAKWYWDHGDGTSDSSSTGPAFSHNFARAGKYRVSLSVRNTLGCVSNVVRKDITVYPKPIAGFGLPEICLDDAFAIFADSSKIADNSTLSYDWDFGDGNAGTGLSPKHKYTRAGNYTVVQYVSSANACKDTLSQAFTVNGAVPQAAIELLGSVFCSNRIVSIRNKSTVDFGNITRLVIQWDVNNPAIQTVDEAPVPDKAYIHQYPKFSQPATKTVTMKMTAFSGTVCQGEVTRQVVLQGSPDLSFGAIPDVCDNTVPFRLTQGRDNSGLPASGKYLGTGVIADSIFSPSQAGKGTHALLYVSTTSAGCTDTIGNQVVVNETPKVDAGPDRVALEGTFITLEATAGPGATQFRWSPPEGLDDINVLRPVASPKRDVNYILTVESARGCIGKDEVFVRYLPKLVIPNTFTPNNDGYNDKWEIKGLQTYTGCVIEVFNTAGTLIFRSIGYGQEWDGSYQGKQLPAGTYYYVIDPKNNRPRFSGYVTIIR